MDNGKKKPKEKKKKSHKELKALIAIMLFFFFPFGQCHHLCFCYSVLKATALWLQGPREEWKFKNVAHSSRGLTSVLQLSLFTPQLVSVERKLENYFHIPLGSELEVREAASFQRAETMDRNSLPRTGK